MIKKIEENNEKIATFLLESENLKVLVSNYGCIVIDIQIKDDKNQWESVTLGYEKLEEYKTSNGYLGAVIGRISNRIKNSKFILNNTVFKVSKNENENQLHGGLEGFHTKVFSYEIINEREILFKYLSKDLEEGYPGNLDVEVHYIINDNELLIKYRAKSDKDTIVNLTNHSYFNLSSKPNNLKDLYLKIKSNFIAKTDRETVPTGEILNINNTCFDFNEFKEISKVLEENEKELEATKGFDHYFLFEDEKCVILEYPPKNRRLIIETSLPGAQIYTSNFLDERICKDNQKYGFHDAICIETQYMPNDINISENSKTILRKNEKYEEFTRFTFEKIK